MLGLSIYLNLSIVWNNIAVNKDSGELRASSRSNNSNSNIGLNK